MIPEWVCVGLVLLIVIGVFVSMMDWGLLVFISSGCMVAGIVIAFFIVAVEKLLERK